MRMKREEQRKNGLLASNATESSNLVKIKRKTKIELTESLLRQQFSQFGNILFVIVSKNGKSAVLEFENNKSLKALEAGCPSQFEVDILSTNRTSSAANESMGDESKEDKVQATIPIEDHDDYEAFVFQQILQADTNKRKAAN